MQLLPRKGILAITAVIDIALHARSGPVAAKALATRHGLPPRRLEPVLQALVRHGILKGTRGPRGGYNWRASGAASPRMRSCVPLAPWTTSRASRSTNRSCSIRW